MNRVTLSDVRSEALSAIQAIRDGKLDVKQAQEIRGMLNTIVDTSKVEVEFLRSMPKPTIERMSPIEIRAIAASIEDKDVELDRSLDAIKKAQNHYS
jgi:hypothetical protein